MKRLLFAITIVTIAFSYIESAIVVYLRARYYPAGIAFPLEAIDNPILWIEIGREAATIILLLGLGYLAGKNFNQRFVFFTFAFGLWDIFYYIWLKVLINWPDSFLTWDILFLIPLPWVGPVLSPMIVSICLIISSIIVLYFEAQKNPLKLSSVEWNMLVSSGVIIVMSYLYNLVLIKNHGIPEYYPWWIFFIGLTMALFVFCNRVRQHLSGKDKVTKNNKD